MFFVADAKVIIETSRSNAIRSVDYCRVQMYWHLGRRIFEEEQKGEEGAEYGTFLIRNLAKVLQPEFGCGFGVRQLERARQFFREFPIASTLRTQLNWSQYRSLILSLPEGNNSILASQYQLHLPTTEQLKQEVEEVKRMIEKEKTKTNRE